NQRRVLAWRGARCAAAAMIPRRDVATTPDGQRALTLCRDRSYCGCTCGRKANAHRRRPQCRPLQPPRKLQPLGRRPLRTPSAMMAAALAAAAILSSTPPANAAGTVKIGILWPLTGNAAAAGQPSRAAAEVAADIVNNKHPELANLPLAATEGLPNQGGAKLELIFVDHQGNPSLAQQLATRLITQDAIH